MRVGFLHLGGSEHGIRQYGATLADGLRDRGVSVHQLDIPTHSGSRIREAARQLGDNDVVHIQWSRRLWGEGSEQRRTLSLLFDSLSVPVVTSVHDVHADLGLRSVASRNWRRGRDRLTPWRAQPLNGGVSEGGWTPRNEKPSTSQRRTLRQRVDTALAPAIGEDAQGLRVVLRRGAATLVCSQSEAARLRGLNRRAHVVVVPHFIEDVETPNATAARAALGVASQRLVTVVGFIHPRKGHHLAVQALPSLPSDTMMVFAGGATDRHHDYLDSLLRAAEELGVRDRLVVTGYLPRAQLASWLAATDLGLCPYRRIAASGSLALLLGADRPILAYDVPYIRELNSQAPGAIATLRSLQPGEMAAQILATLDAGHTSNGSAGRARSALIRQRSLPQTADNHLAVYRSLLADRATVDDRS